MQTFTVVVLICTPTNRESGCLSKSSPTFVVKILLTAILSGVKYWLFKMSSLKKCHFRSFAHLLIGSFISLVFDFWVLAPHPCLKYSQQRFLLLFSCLFFLLVVSLLCRNSSFACSPIRQLLCCWCSVKSFLAYSTVLRTTPVFSSRSFSASSFKWRFLIHFEFILYKMKDKNLTSLFCKQKSSFASTVLFNSLFPQTLRCQQLSGHRFATAFPGPVFYYAS